MITRMTGILNRVLDEEVRMQVGAFEFQVLVPEVARRQLQSLTGQEVTLHIQEYLEGNQMSNRLVPRRIGFLTASDEDFFDLFCTVDGVGVRKALKALGRPIKEIAGAIQRQDAKWLTTLPGVGKQSADKIIAQLKAKVARFTVLNEPGDAENPQSAVEGQIVEDAYEALMGLGLSPLDARTLLDRVLASGEPITNAMDVVNLAFKQQKK